MAIGMIAFLFISIHRCLLGLVRGVCRLSAFEGEGGVVEDHVARPGTPRRCAVDVPCLSEVHLVSSILLLRNLVELAEFLSSPQCLSTPPSTAAGTLTPARLSDRLEQRLSQERFSQAEPGGSPHLLAHSTV
ncbi:MAG: hypothetical protein MPJ50_13995 [Pirellulales bacterium]|nr:hypothetical protein [Pirellulales bacterium]